MSARVVVIVGAQGTGKTTLAAALHERLAADGRRVALLEWRASGPARHLQATAAAHDVVIVDAEEALPDATTAIHLALLCALEPPGPPAPACALHRVESLLREALDRAGLSYAVMRGSRTERRAAALAALEASERTQDTPGTIRWHHLCAECGDAQCERHLFLGRA